MGNKPLNGMRIHPKDGTNGDFQNLIFLFNAPVGGPEK